MTSTLAPPCSGPHRALTPAAQEANRLARDRSHRADRGGAAILLVVRVQDEDQVQRVFHLRFDSYCWYGMREHHVQEVGTVPQVRVGVDEGQPMDRR